MLKRKHLIIFASLVLLTMMLLVGCGREEMSLDGKNIVTFDLNGGMLDFKTSSSTTQVHFAYEPGTYVLDPSEIPGYKLFRSDYEFTGWYTSADCKPEEKWDFSADTLNDPALTLYAGWIRAIRHTYTVYYIDDEGNTVSLGEYRVDAGDRFNDRLKYGNKRQGYTMLDYYSDKELTAKWDNDFAHPGGDEDKNIPVYVSYIPGEWALVYNFSELKSAINASKNAYLMNDIDCGGEELRFLNAYDGILEGNGYTVSDFTVTSSGSIYVKCAIFQSLGESAEIRNISFTEANYVVTDYNATSTRLKIEVAALAYDAALGAHVYANVSVSGVITTTYDGELSRLNEAIFNSESAATVDQGFTANITYASANE